MKKDTEMRDGDILVVARCLVLDVWCQMLGTRRIPVLLQFD